MDSSDNSNSLVVLLEYQERRVLLTGNLEGSGLDALLRQPPLACDIMLAPHHGSLFSNPRGFSQWARPEWLVVSGGKRETVPPLAQQYGRRTKVLSTQVHGSVELLVGADGSMECRTHRSGLVR